MLAAPGTFTGTQSLKSPCRSFTRSMSSLQTCSRDSERPLPDPGLQGPPRASLRGDAAAGASHPLPRYPGHCAVVSPPCPAAPRRPAAAVAGSGWLEPRDEKAIKSSSSSATGGSRTARITARSSRAPGARRPWRAAAPRPPQLGWAVSPKLASLIISPLG